MAARGIVTRTNSGSHPFAATYATGQSAGNYVSAGAAQKAIELSAGKLLQWRAMTRRDGVETMVGYDPTPQPPPAPAPSTQRAMFTWVPSVDGPDDPLATPESRAALLAFCTENDVVTVFLDMYNYIGADHASPTTTARLQAFIGSASAAGINVQALAGATDFWTVPAFVQSSIVDPINTYNAASSASQRFRGLIYDVEYWVDDVDDEAACSALMEIVTDTKASFTAGMTVGLFSAFYLLTSPASRPLVDVDGVVAQEGVHFLTYADYVVVGTYRNTAAANLVDDVAGIVQLFEPWHEYMLTAPGTMAWAGAETTDVEPAYITFFGVLATMPAQLEIVDEEFEGGASSPYQGVAVHSYAGWSV